VPSSPPPSAPGMSPLIIGKSLGSYAARIAVDHAVPAGWLTPLLHDATVVDALRAASAPFLLIGGTADREAWSTPVAHELMPHVREITMATTGCTCQGRWPTRLPSLASSLPRCSSSSTRRSGPTEDRWCGPRPSRRS